MALSTWLSLLSPTAGFLGALVQKGIGLYEERQRHRHEMERLELASRIDVQRADLALRQTREEQSGAAFTAAVQGQTTAGAAASHRWARDVIALFRPGLTTIVLMASIGHASWLMFSGADSTEFWQGIHSLSSMAFAFWFGVRTFDKAPEIRLAAPAAPPAKK